MDGLMKAAVFKGLNYIEVETRPMPKCDDDGLLLKVHFCGICGGDYRNFKSGLKGGITNQILGHEIAGEIIEVGCKVKSWRVGQKVALAPDISCGECWYCKHGMVNLCLEHRMLGTHLPGGYAQYIALPKDVLEHGFIELIPKGMSYQAAAFAEAAAGVVACQKRLNISAGDTVIVVGDGPIGCLHVEMAHARGAKVIMLARGKIDQVAKFEPDIIVDNRQPERAIEKVLEFTNGLGADFVILAVPNVEAQGQALQMVRKRGVVVIYGGAPKGKSSSQIDSNIIHYNEINLVGSFSYSRTGLADALEAIRSNQIHAEKYINAIVSLEELKDVMPRNTHKDALKILIDPWIENV